MMKDFIIGAIAIVMILIGSHFVIKHALDYWCDNVAWICERPDYVAPFYWR